MRTQGLQHRPGMARGRGNMGDVRVGSLCRASETRARADGDGRMRCRPDRDIRPRVAHVIKTLFAEMVGQEGRLVRALEIAALRRAIGFVEKPGGLGHGRDLPVVGGRDQCGSAPFGPGRLQGVNDILIQGKIL